MKNCPCCSGQMQRHIQKHQIYWFCRHCWQEMPVIQSNNLSSLIGLTTSNSSPRIAK